MFVVDGEIFGWFEWEMCFFRRVDDGDWMISKVRDYIIVVYVYIYLKRVFKYGV